jgi:hypothetical protein
LTRQRAGSPFERKALCVTVSSGAIFCLALIAAAPGRGQTAVVWRPGEAGFGRGPGVERLGHPQRGGGVNRSGDPRAWLHFDGRGDGFLLPLNPIAGWPRFTVQVRFRPDGMGPPEQRFLHIEDAAGNRLTIETRLDAASSSWALDTFLKSAHDRRTLLDRGRLHPAARWHWAALRYADGAMDSFVDGRLELSGRVAFPPMGAGRSAVGVRLNRVSWFKGDLAEFRFTPAALSEAELER